MKEIVTAIDIGTTKIIALAGKKDQKGKIKILGTGSVKTPRNSVKRGVVLNITEAAKAIKQAVSIAEEKSGIRFKNAFIGIAGQHIKSQKSTHSLAIDSKDNLITQEHIDKMLGDMRNISLEPGEKILHVIPQNYIVNKESGVEQPVGMYGKRLMGSYHIVVGEMTSVQNIKRCVKNLNIEVNKLILEPLASAEAVLAEDEKEAGIALIDIGGGTTDMAIYYDGVLRHTAVIPYGGNVVTNDIRLGCSILKKYAEKIKVNHGKALSDFAKAEQHALIPGINGREKKEISLKTVAQIIQARMEEICEIIDFELINSEYKGKLGAGIALTGGGSLLQHLPQLMKYKTGLDVSLAKPGRILNVESMDIDNPKYSTAVGLIKLGLKYSNKITVPNISIKEERELLRESEEQKIREEVLRKEKEAEAKRKLAEEETKQKEEAERQTAEDEKKKRGMMEKLGSIFTNIFDERDTEMKD